jgi:hypothetical protein
MTPRRRTPPHEAADPEPPSPLMRALAWAMVALPALGIAAHLALWLAAPVDVIRAYTTGLGLKVAALAAVGNIVANWLHYRATGMRLDVLSRVLSYLWLISIVLLWKALLAAS